MAKIKVAIIGVGLIGGSLGFALRKSGKFYVIGIGRHPEKLKKAKKLGAVDDFTSDFANGVSYADIVVVCTPVDIISETVRSIIPHVRDGAVITDVGSVKGEVSSKVRKVLESIEAKRKKIVFVGAHPMAGSEKTGVIFAKKDLFNKATVVLLAENVKSAAFAKVKKMWSVTGARIKIMKAKDHDRAVAFISHLPHAIAFNLCRIVGTLKDAEKVSSLLAGSFRDMTRVADSSPRDWAAISSMNKEELAKAIDIFIYQLKEMRKKLGDRNALEKNFSKAKSARLKLLNNHGMEN